MNKKNITLISLLLVLSLSAAGYAYAMWSDHIHVQGEVNTDSLTMAWVTDEWGEPLNYHDNERDDKDYAWATIVAMDPVSDVNGNGFKTLKIDVYNAYPGYYIQFDPVNIGNLGTTPFDILSFTVEGYDETSDNELVWEHLYPGWVPPYAEEYYGVFYEELPGGTTGLDPEGSLGDDWPGEERIWLNIVSLSAEGPYQKGIQIHPGGKFKGEIDLYFLQPMEECNHYTFYITIKCVQWNWLDAVGPYNMDLPPA